LAQAAPGAAGAESWRMFGAQFPPNFFRDSNGIEIELNG
jgi:hypothetical protein